MGMPRAEMMARMPAREFDEWLLFMTLYPDGIGERGRYARSGAITAMIASVNRDPKVHRDGFTYRDVYPWLVGEAESDEPTPEETAARMRAAFAGAGARIIDLRERT